MLLLPSIMNWRFENLISGGLDLKLARPHPNLVYGVGDGVLVITSGERERV